MCPVGPPSRLPRFVAALFTLDESFAADLRKRPAVWLDRGSDNYAGVTWANVPEEDGRRIFIGWMSNWNNAQQVPTDPWRSAMTLSWELRLAKSPAGYRVHSEPVAEFASPVHDVVAVRPAHVNDSLDVAADVGLPVSTSELVLEFQNDGTTAREFGVMLSNEAGETCRIGYDRDKNACYSDRRFAASFADRVHWAPRLPEAGPVRMRLVFDVASVELFADGGATVRTDIFFPARACDRMTVYARDGEAVILRGSLGFVQRIW